MQSDAVDFSGKRIVVVEDDHLLALDICRDLRALGATVLGPAPTAFYAMQLIGRKDRRNIDASVLDIRLHGVTVFEVAEKLQDRGVPFIFATAQEPSQLPRRFSATPVVQKPFLSTKLVKELHVILRKPQIRQPAPPVLPPPELPLEAHFARALARSMKGQ